MVFTYTPAALKPTAKLLDNLEAMVKGELLAPVEIEQKLAKRLRLLSTQGLVGIALPAPFNFHARRSSIQSRQISSGSQINRKSFGSNITIQHRGSSNLQPCEILQN
jgi:hypothetical protein